MLEKTEDHVFGEEIRYEQLHRYALALDLCQDRQVLDLGCGVGHGAMLLASSAQGVTGIDIDAESIRTARRQCHNPKVRFQVGDGRALPLADDSFDVVVCFEIIELFSEHDQMLSEIRRVLRPDGFLVISSTKRVGVNADERMDHVAHLSELLFDEFSELLRRHFPNITYYGQRLASASMVYRLTDTGDVQPISFSGNADRIHRGRWGLKAPATFIALCSTGNINHEGLDSLYYDSDVDLFALLNHQRRSLIDKLHYFADLFNSRREPAVQVVAESPLALRGSDGHSNARELELRVAGLEAYTEQLLASRSELETLVAGLTAEKQIILGKLQQVEGERTSQAVLLDGKVAELESELSLKRNEVATLIDRIRKLDGERKAQSALFQGSISSIEADLSLKQVEVVRLTDQVRYLEGEQQNRADVFEKSVATLEADLAAQKADVTRLKANLATSTLLLRNQSVVLRERAETSRLLRDRVSFQSRSLLEMRRERRDIKAQLLASSQFRSVAKMAEHNGARRDREDISHALRLAQKQTLAAAARRRFDVRAIHELLEAFLRARGEARILGFALNSAQIGLFNLKATSDALISARAVAAAEMSSANSLEPQSAPEGSITLVGGSTAPPGRFRKIIPNASIRARLRRVANRLREYRSHFYAA
jgi:SAM-dependent methyltransferase